MKKLLNMTRRDFLQHGAGIAGTLMALPPWIAKAQATALAPDQVTVLIFLRGAMDPLSLLVPAANSIHRPAYEMARPNLKIPAGVLLRVSGVDDFRMHPSGKELHELMQGGSLKILLGCGSLNPTTSHFAQQDNMELGQGAGFTAGLRGGVLSRALVGLDRSPILPAVSLNSVLDKSLSGPGAAIAVTSLNADSLANPLLSSQISMADRLKLGWIESSPISQAEQRQRYYAGNARNSIVALHRAAGVQVTLSPMNGSLEVSNHDVHYAGINQMQNAVRLIKAEPKLRFITLSIDGWDDHYNQGPIGGSYDLRVKRLSRAMKALKHDLHANGLLDRTNVVVLSEFGRTIHENATLGTDHGRGGIAMVLGNNLGGGSSVLANGFTLDRSNAEVARGFLPVSYDYRNVLAEVLTKRMQVTNLTNTSGNPQGVFPGLNYVPYGILG